MPQTPRSNAGKGDVKYQDVTEAGKVTLYDRWSCRAKYAAYHSAINNT